MPSWLLTTHWQKEAERDLVVTNGHGTMGVNHTTYGECIEVKLGHNGTLANTPNWTPKENMPLKKFQNRQRHTENLEIGATKTKRTLEEGCSTVNCNIKIKPGKNSKD